MTKHLYGLVRNPKLISVLPTGFTFAAGTQIAARGRGSNVWVAPPGQLILSTVIHHPHKLSLSRPMIFIQYIAGVAIVEAIHQYGPGYDKLGVKLKWPNDICESDERRGCHDTCVFIMANTRARRCH
jgi:biotin---protein ligase